MCQGMRSFLAHRLYQGGDKIFRYVDDVGFGVVWIALMDFNPVIRPDDDDIPVARKDGNGLIVQEYSPPQAVPRK